VILLDTNAVIWFGADDKSLGRTSRRQADAALARAELAVSAISFWEIALLISKGRLKVLAPTAILRSQLLGAGVNELPLTGDIALLSVELENLPNDPADRFIAATAIAHNATLMTADAALLRWQHPLPRQNARR